MRKIFRRYRLHVLVVAVILGPWFLQHLWDQREAAARRSALERAPALVKNHFHSAWTSITREGGEAVAWSGSSSELLYLQLNGSRPWPKTTSSWTTGTTHRNARGTTFASACVPGSLRTPPSCAPQRPTAGSTQRASQAMPYRAKTTTAAGMTPCQRATCSWMNRTSPLH